MDDNSDFDMPNGNVRMILVKVHPTYYGTTNPYYTLVRVVTESWIYRNRFETAIKRLKEIHPHMVCDTLSDEGQIVHYQGGMDIKTTGVLANFYRLVLDQKVHGYDVHYVVASSMENAIAAAIVPARIVRVERLGSYLPGDDMDFTS